jgi:signal transduction histidine kinase/CheY-like chemotaxis protein
MLVRAWVVLWPVHFTVAAGLAVCLAVFNEAPTGLIAGLWLALMSACLAARWGVRRRLARDGASSYMAADWLRSVRRFSGLMGAVWGMLPLWTFAHLTGANQGLVTFAFLIIAGPTAVLLGEDAFAMWAFLLPALSLLSTAWFTMGTKLPIVFGLAVLVTLYVSAMVGRCRRRDFDDRVQAVEDMLQRNSALERSNQFRAQMLAVASHDLRQPVHALGLLVEKLRMDVARTGYGNQVDTIVEVVRGMSASLDALLDIAQVDVGGRQPKPQEVDLADLFERLACEYQPMAHNKNLLLLVEPGAPPVRSDAVFLQQILGNLLSNALRYTTVGSVTLRARPCADHGQVRIEVCDTGRGIPSEYLDQIFEDYFRLTCVVEQERGLGLGLAIVRRTAMALGHKLEVNSQLGQGSVFAVEVPAGQHVTAARPTKPPPSPRPLRGRCVVVVENDCNVLRGMQALLETWGCRCMTACSGEELSQKLASLGGSKIDAVITDLHLDAQGTGLDAIRMVRNAQRHAVAALLLTGDVHVRADAYADMQVQVAHKPVSPARLRALLEEAIVGADRKLSANAGAPGCSSTSITLPW